LATGKQGKSHGIGYRPSLGREEKGIVKRIKLREITKTIDQAENGGSGQTRRSLPAK